MPLGVVMRRTPGVTRWARWHWIASGILPGAQAADWRELRRDGETVEYHADTVPLTLWATDTEAYRVGLADNPPCIYVILREATATDARMPYEVHLVTASPYEAQDYADSGEEIVEKVPMSAGLIAWVQAFIDTHHEDEVFIKRRRDKKRVDLVEDGIGDSRIEQLTDVYRAPRRKAGLQ
ncbi:DUF3305 domain-containing protein [Fluviibacterium sp. DFM31]|uniref:DUF3305 domain-containing protein n=2 Tax=Meridianimarinicoccus marinus TaxID=3231483 RepID=A0ABV3L6J3_9RHOB